MPNWIAIVSDLQERYGRTDLARKVEAGVSTLADLATGKTTEPRHSLGVLLLQLHAKRGRPATRKTKKVT